MTLRRWVVCPDVSEGRIAFPFKSSGIPEFFYLRNARKALSLQHSVTSQKTWLLIFGLIGKMRKAGVLHVVSLRVFRDVVK